MKDGDMIPHLVFCTRTRTLSSYHMCPRLLVHYEYDCCCGCSPGCVRPQTADIIYSDSVILTAVYILLHTAVSCLRVPGIGVFQAISLAVASAPHHHQAHQDQDHPPTNTAGSRDRTEDMASTADASAAVTSVGSSWEPDSAEGGHRTINTKRTPPPPYTRVVGSTTPVTGVAAAPASVRSAVASEIGNLQEQGFASPVTGDALQPSSAGGDADAATQSKMSPSSGSSPKSWSDATAESGASADSLGKGASPLSSVPNANGTPDDSGPWKFRQSTAFSSTSGEAGGSKVGL